MTLSTSDFLAKMRDPRFTRIDLYSGLLEGKIYKTDHPPEIVSGSFNSELDSLRRLSEQD